MFIVQEVRLIICKIGEEYFWGRVGRALVDSLSVRTWAFIGSYPVFVALVILAE